MSKSWWDKVKKIRKKTDKLWCNKHIKEKCEVCGSKEDLLCHHFYYKKTFSYLRYSKDNCITLCEKCHYGLHAGGDPKRIENKIIEKRSLDWFLKLKEKSENKIKVKDRTLGYYKDMLKKLKEDD